MFANEIRKRRLHHRSFSHWRWHLDEVFVRINGETHYLWLAVDHEGEVLEVFATKRRDRKAALKFLKRMMKRYGRPGSIVTGLLPTPKQLRCWHHSTVGGTYGSGAPDGIGGYFFKDITCSSSWGRAAFGTQVWGNNTLSRSCGSLIRL